MVAGDVLFVGQAAAELGVSATDLSKILYGDAALASRCPLLGNRRLIPREVLPTIAATLRRMGRTLKPHPANQANQLEVEA